MICAVVTALTVVLLTAASKTPQVTGAKSLPRATCFCQVSDFDLYGKTSPAGVFLDLTDTVNKTYGGVYQQQESNQVECQSLCKQAAENLGEQSIRNSACAANLQTYPPDWVTTIGVFSRVGTRPFRVAKNIGVLLNKPEVKSKVCTCPANWFSNTTNVLGGYTADGRCKKLAGHITNVTPLPPDGTQIDSWGVTWSNEIWAYGSVQNGGAATCVEIIVQPHQCY
jgi:hypothetical protein